MGRQGWDIQPLLGGKQVPATKGPCRSQELSTSTTPIYHWSFENTSEAPKHVGGTAQEECHKIEQGQTVKKELLWEHPPAYVQIAGSQSWAQQEDKGLAAGNLSPRAEVSRDTGCPGLCRLPVCLSGLFRPQEPPHRSYSTLFFCDLASRLSS